MMVVHKLCGGDSHKPWVAPSCRSISIVKQNRYGTLHKQIASHSPKHRQPVSLPVVKTAPSKRGRNGNSANQNQESRLDQICQMVRAAHARQGKRYLAIEEVMQVTGRSRSTICRALNARGVRFPRKVAKSSPRGDPGIRME